MYGKSMAASPTVGALAYTGVNVGWWLVGALTLIFLGLALLRYIPRRNRNKNGK